MPITCTWQRQIEADEWACKALEEELRPAVEAGHIVYRFTRWSINSCALELTYTRRPGDGPEVHEFTGRCKSEALRRMRAHLYGESSLNGGHTA